ncbi:MAG: hypothetical protein IPQ08_05900 [Chitinophagaceae bacterium]|nr:hypothetical protein [Chitinophagaceae bacterium]
MSTTHSSTIPDFITAQSPMGLRRLMFATNARAGAMFQYFDIQQITDNGKVKWIAWFYRDVRGIGGLTDDNAEQL